MPMTRDALLARISDVLKRSGVEDAERLIAEVERQIPAPPRTMVPGEIRDTMNALNAALNVAATNIAGIRIYSSSAVPPDTIIVVPPR